MDIEKNFIILLDIFTCDMDFSIYEDAEDFLIDVNYDTLEEFAQENDTYYAYFYDMVDFFCNRSLNAGSLIEEKIKDYFNQK